MSPDDLLTYEDVAEKLGCTVRHVRALVKSGRLLAVRWGLGDVRPRKKVERAEFERFLAAGKEPAPGPVKRASPRRVPAFTRYV